MLILGSKHEKSCFPVHIGCGLSSAGTGSLPSQLSRFMRMLNVRSRVMKLSRKVNFITPSKVSCTIPITGLLACGDTT